MNNHEIKSSALQPGFLIGGGRYTLARIVEVRAASELWVALDNQLGEEVALRVFSRAISSDPGVASKLRHAAQRSRKLSHPNIARVFDFVETPGEAAVIAMERIEAANLGESRLNRPGQVMSWSELEPIVLQVAEALDYAWNEGVAWGNLRPWNLPVE